MARPGGVGMRHRRHVAARTANASRQVGGRMSEGMEDKVDPRIGGSEATSEAMKKPMAGDKDHSTENESMGGEMEDSTASEMREPMGGNMEDSTAKEMREPMGGDMDDATE